MNAIVIAQELDPYNRDFLHLRLQVDQEVEAGIKYAGKFEMIVPTAQAALYLPGTAVVVSVKPRH